MFGKKQDKEETAGGTTAVSEGDSAAEVASLEAVSEEAGDVVLKKVANLEDIIKVEDAAPDVASEPATGIALDDVAPLGEPEDEEVEALLEKPNEGSSRVKEPPAEEVAEIFNPETAAEAADDTGPAPAKSATGEDGDDEEDDDDDEGKTEDNGESGMDDLFSMEEEESKPLAALIADLPDVTVDELLEDIENIKDLVTKNRLEQT